MGKVKQAIQEVEEEIISLVEDGFKLNEIKELKQQIINLHTNFLKQLNLPPVKSLYIKGWFNIMKKNEKIKPHAHGVHPDIYLGGHFYLGL